MKKIGKRILSLVLVLAVMLTMTLIPSLAASNGSKLSQSTVRDIRKMGVDGFARFIAWFTTNAPQNIPPELSEILEQTPVETFSDNAFDKETFTLTSFDGTHLKCYWYKTPNGCKWGGKNHVVIIAHGFQVDHMGVVMFLPMFLDAGYDVILFDQRQAGASDRVKCTMGVNESRDVGELAKWVRKEYGQNVVLGLKGHSMGAATVCQYAPNDPDLAFLIEDCGYTSMKNLAKYLQKSYFPFVPFKPFYRLANQYAAVGKVSYDDANALNAIRKLDPEVPALFIHGGNDTFIPTFMVNDFYRAKRGIKEKWICPGAGHDQSWLFGIAKYRSVVYEFLSHNGLMKR